jgi:hypothetical protein
MRKSEKRKMIPNVFNNFNKSVSVFGELNKIWSFLGRGYCRNCAKRKRFDIKWLRCHYVFPKTIRFNFHTVDIFVHRKVILWTANLSSN